MQSLTASYAHAATCNHSTNFNCFCLASIAIDIMFVLVCGSKNNISHFPLRPMSCVPFNSCALLIGNNLQKPKHTVYDANAQRDIYCKFISTSLLCKYCIERAQQRERLCGQMVFVHGPKCGASQLLAHDVLGLQSISSPVII